MTTLTLINLWIHKIMHVCWVNEAILDPASGVAFWHQVMSWVPSGVAVWHQVMSRVPSISCTGASKGAIEAQGLFFLEALATYRLLRSFYTLQPT